jgi:poly(A) polymerase
LKSPRPISESDLSARLARRAAREPLLAAARAAAVETGVRAWLVGGAVRDVALGRSGADLDLAAGRPAERLIAALARAWGHRGFRVRKRGVTTWRFRVGEHLLDVVDAGYRGIRRDLHRRELTLNAMAFDLVEETLVDPFGGLRDMRAGLLRPTHDSVMTADPVRALRACRFLAQLPAFRLHRDGGRQARAVASRLRRASGERIGEELDKLLVAADPARGLEWMARLGVLDGALPELVPLRHCVAGRDRPDVWRHTLDAIERSTRAGRLPGGGALREGDGRRVLRWALLLHDISKPETLGSKADGSPSFHGHEELGARRAEALMRRLRVPRALRARVERLIRFHLRPGHLADAGAPPRGLRRLARETGEDLPLLLVHAACDALASGSPDATRRWRRLRAVLLSLLRLHARGGTAPLPRLVGGRDAMRLLGLEAGPAVGRALRAVEEGQAEGLIRTRAEALRFLRGLAREGEG